MLDKKLVKLKAPSSHKYIDIYNFYKDKLLYIHGYSSVKSFGLATIGDDKNDFLFWYPVDSLEYLSNRLIRFDIKIV